MSTTGGLNVAAKRNALADRNHLTKGGADLPYSKPTIMKSNSAIVKAQENRDAPVPKDAFLRPAQRPIGRTIAPSASMSHIRREAQSQKHMAKRDFQPKYVYNDNQPAKDQHRYTGSQITGSNTSRSARYTIAGVPQQLVHPPREDQAVASSTNLPIAWGAHHPDDDLNTIDQKPVEQYLPVVDSDSRHHAPEDEQSGVPESDDLVNMKSPNLSRVAEQDDNPDNEVVNDAQYVDALEEIPPEASIHESELRDLFPMRRPTAPPVVKSTTSIETKVVDFQTVHEPTPADDNANLSDYDDEDYYDDQGYTTAHSFRSRGDNTTGGVTTVMFPPKLTKKGQAELDAAKLYVEERRTPEEIQEDDWDVSMVAEYGDEIFQYMKQLESDLLPNPHYMDIQTEIQWSMRSVLMDWVVQVHTRFGLLPETLFLAVNYIDRFLSYKVVSLGKLQLVGATALFVAAKYEEINCPSVQEIVYMVDHGYNPDEILKAERFMLSMLNFELGWPGPMSFLRRISKADDYDLETRTLSKYFLEVAIMDERFVASPPSYIAAGSHCISRLILSKGEWTPAHVHYSGYTYNQLKPLIGMMLDCCRMACKHHAAVYEKYSDKRYRRASIFVENELQKGFNLAFQQHTSYHVPLDLFDDDVVPMSYPDRHALQMPFPVQG
ncbi:cyclin-like protein [Xylariaceae sp. FL0016]|nr:cyclin-like protein [Xylariaceae sp. FL0016]